jgi:hypothetical protein
MKILAIVGALAAGPALADDCASAWQQLAGLGLGYDVTGMLVATADGCTGTDLRLASQSDYGLDITIDRLTLTATDLAGLMAATPTTGNLRLDLTGIRTVSVLPDPVLAYLYAVHAQGHPGYDLSVDLSYDVAAGAYDLRQATADFGALGRVSLSVGLSGLLSDLLMSPDEMMAGLAVDRFRLEVTTTGLFEMFLLIPLGTEYLSGPDPAAALQDLQDELTALVADLPDRLIDQGSRTALTALVAALPNPRGQLVVDGAAAPGFLIALADAPPAQPVTDLLAGMTATITYTAIPDPAQ